MKKLLCLLLCLTFLPLLVASAETLALCPVGETVHPGRAVLLCFMAPRVGVADILIVDGMEQVVSYVVQGHVTQTGTNTLYWNGTWQGVPVSEGEYAMVLRMDGETVSVPVSVGGYAPYLSNLSVSTEVVTPTTPLTVSFAASVPGTLNWGLSNGVESIALGQMAVNGAGSITWQGEVPAGTVLTDGDWFFTLMMMDQNRVPSTMEHLSITLSGFGMAEPGITPEPVVEPTATPVPEVTAAPEPIPVEENPDDMEDPMEEEEEFPDEAFDEEEQGPMDESLTEEVQGADLQEVVIEELDQSMFTPSYGSPYANEDTAVTYWNTPMDITDEARIWEMLMSPMVVIDGNEKTQVVLRAEPDEESEGVGVITRATQGVRVIEEMDNGWTLIECYSSSFHDSKVKAWNMLVQGYVKSNTIKTVKPATKRGYVVDKLTQRLYIFEDGKLFTTLLVSTGLANERQPYNETRSGEFLLTSAVGEFKSDNLACSMALRFNDGDLLHEVPHVKLADGGKNYKHNEPKLGTKASHGCIRVQRKRTPEGVNMQWLWNNRVKNTRLIIWEDWQGRQISIPSDDTVLYYNPKGGEMYHSAETCYSVKNNGVTFEAFTYGELDMAPYAELKTCDYCTPVLRREQYDAINEQYAPGGDHDPVMTEARAKLKEQ